MIILARLFLYLQKITTLHMIKKILKWFIPDETRTRYIAPYIRNIKNTKRKHYAKSGNSTQLFGPLTLEPENIELEDYTRLQPNIRVINAGGKLIVKKYSAIGAGTTIIASEHVPTVGLPQFASTLHINDIKGTVIIEEDAWVGTESIILSRSKIGRGAVVAAGSVVTKPIPPYAVVAGSPAKVIAVRFSLEQVLEHERILYPPEERTPKAVLEELYSTVYKDKKSLGVSTMSSEDTITLNEYRKSIGMETYEIH